MNGRSCKSPPIPTYPGFRYWEICRGMWGFVSPILPQLLGNCNFQECKSPPQPVPGVVGYYIDRCITSREMINYYCVYSEEPSFSDSDEGLGEIKQPKVLKKHVPRYSAY